MRKKIMAMIVALSMVSTFVATGVSAEANRKLGDVNGDGKINVTDITRIAAHIKGKRILSEDEKKFADVNGDDKINVTDITKIAAHIKGKKMLDENANELCTLKVQILDGDGNPVPDTNVRMLHERTSLDEKTCWSDSDGYAVFENLNGYGDCYLSVNGVEKKIYINRKNVDITIHVSKPTQQSIQRTTLELKVLNNEKDKIPLANREISIFSHARGETFSGVTNSDGVIVIPNFPCGTTNCGFDVSKENNSFICYYTLLDENNSTNKVKGTFYKYGMNERLGELANGIEVEITGVNGSSSSGYNEVYTLDGDTIELDLPLGYYRCCVKTIPNELNYSTYEMREYFYVSGCVVGGNSFAVEIW